MSSEKAKIRSLFHVQDDAPEEGTSTKDNRVLAPQPSTCQYCFGTGMEVVAGKGARRCRCRTQNTQSRLVEAARIPRRYDKFTLETYKPIQGKFWGIQKRAKEYASTLASEYPAVNRGLLFMGPVGVGKTHLSVAIIREIIQKGYPCLFYEFGSLLKEIQDSYNPI